MKSIEFTGSWFPCRAAHRRRGRAPFLAAWMTSLLLATTLADESGALPDLTLDQAINEALRSNPELARLRGRTEAMQERPAQAGALANPMFTYSGMDMANGGTWPDTSEKRFMVQQEFSWFGKRALRAGIAAKDAEAMQHELEAMTREVVMMVKETYF